MLEHIWQKKLLMQTAKKHVQRSHAFLDFNVKTFSRIYFRQNFAGSEPKPSVLFGKNESIIQGPSQTEILGYKSSTVIHRAVKQLLTNKYDAFFVRFNHSFENKKGVQGFASTARKIF